MKKHNIIEVGIDLHDCKDIPPKHIGARIIAYGKSFNNNGRITIGILKLSLGGGTPIVEYKDGTWDTIRTYTIIEFAVKDFEAAISKYNRKH